MQGGLRQSAGGDRARDRQLGGEGGQDVADEEDAGGTGAADAALERGEDEREDRPVRGVQPAGHPQGTGDEDEQRAVREVGGVGAGVAQQLIDRLRVAVVGVDGGGDQDQAVEERERRAEGGGEQPAEGPERPARPAGRVGGLVGVNRSHSGKPLSAHFPRALNIKVHGRAPNQPLAVTPVTFVNLLTRAGVGRCVDYARSRT